MLEITRFGNLLHENLHYQTGNLLMPQLYSRVFLQILDSSLANDWKARYVFEDFLKLANEDGVVDMTREAIARRTNVPLELVAHGIGILESPDTGSRDPRDGGRRLVRLDDHRDWGWRIVNWNRYDAIRSNVEHRAAKAREMARYRAKQHSPDAIPSPTPSPNTNTKETTPSPTPEDPLHVGNESATCSLQVEDKKATAREEKMLVLKRILFHLNSKTGSQFRAVESHLKLIESRLAEPGVDEAGMLTMIDRQVKKWKNDPKMSEFLRPQTLFGKEKFQNYYDQRELPVHQGSTSNGSVAENRNSFIGGQDTWEATSGKRALAEGKGFGLE